MRSGRVRTEGAVTNYFSAAPETITVVYIQVGRNARSEHAPRKATIDTTDGKLGRRWTVSDYSTTLLVLVLVPYVHDSIGSAVLASV